MKLRQFPPRLATGAFILNSGLGKRSADEQTAQALHGMAAGAFPFLAKIQPTTFVKALSSAEIALGAALMLPIVPTRLAALGLAGFSGSLLTMYARTPELHGEGMDLRPSQAGVPIAKDVFMLGIAGGLLVDTLGTND